MTGTPIAHIPTPYGVSIPVFGNPDNPDDLWHDIDGCMTLAGIYAKADRSRCWEAIKSLMGKGGIPFDVFLEHGGRKVPKVPLPRPKDPVYPNLPRGFEMDIPIENWVTLVLDHSSWDKRADVLINIIGGNIDAAKSWSAPPEVIAIGLQHLLTAALEHLPDTEIDCLEAAALYALTLHDEWSSAGVEWLKPIRKTWFGDWVAARPGYRRFAKVCSSSNPKLPTWIVRGRT